jgi:hypothetical protein
VWEKANVTTGQQCDSFRLNLVIRGSEHCERRNMIFFCLSQKEIEERHEIRCAFHERTLCKRFGFARA